VINANTFFLDVIGQSSSTVVGKPFSLFVAVEDLAHFFSHWNELPGKSNPGSLEIKLRHPRKNTVSVHIGYEKIIGNAVRFEQVILNVTDISQRQIDTNQLDHKDNLISLIFSISKCISTSANALQENAVIGILEKIGSFAGAEKVFFCHFNEEKGSLDSAFQWSQRKIAGPSRENKSISFFLLNQILANLRRKQFCVVEDVKNLSTAERNELFTWQGVEAGAFICHLLIFQNKPVGVIGFSCSHAEQCKLNDFKGLLEFSGLLLAQVLSSVHPVSNTVVQPSELIIEDEYPEKSIDSVSVLSAENKYEDKLLSANNLDPIEELAPEDFLITEEIAPGMQMMFSKAQFSEKINFEKIFAGNMNHVPLICSACGIQNFIPPSTFEELGCYLHVKCPCRNKFFIMREQRRFFRKKIHLEGAFKIANQDQFYFSEANWVPSIMTDLSKLGVRFCTKKIGPVRLGDRVLVQFHLDNSTKTLIEKSAFVQSITENDVGCRFEESREHDVTLGFYLL
jgi:hypothetical protein